jgi:subtilisin-like proprotein convertase family protein
MINNLGNEHLIASAEGVAVVVVNTLGNTESTAFVITNSEPVDSGDATFNDISTCSFSTTLTGTPELGEFWFVQVSQEIAEVTLGASAAGGEIWMLTVNNDPGLEFAHVVSGGQSLAEIATALAALINSDPDAGDFFALAKDETIRILSRSQTPFTIVASITDAPSIETLGEINVAAASSTEIQTYSHVVTLVENDHSPDPSTIDVETLEQIAVRLAEAINNDGSYPDFTGLVDGETLVIVDRFGEPFAIDASVAPAGIGSETTIVLTGTPVDGQIWTVTVDGSDYSVTLDTEYLDVFDTDETPGLAGEEIIAALSQIAIDLAEAINTDTASQATATTNGVNLSILVFSGGVEIAGNTQASSLNVALNGTPRAGQTWAIDVDTTTYAYVVVSSATVTLSGSPAADETWTVVIDGSAALTYQYLTGDSDSLADIAAALALAIHDAANGFTASSDGTVIRIVNSTNDPFAVAGLITNTGGTASEGEITIRSGDQLADVAAGLALAIGGTASADGATLVVPGAASAELLASGSFGVPDLVTAETVTLTGTPAARELWTLTLNDSGQTTYTYEILENDTLADIAAGLALLVNDYATDYIAAAEGEMLVLVRIDANAISTGFSLIPADNDTSHLYTVDGDTPTAVTINLDGIPVDGEQWTVTLNGSNVYSYTVEGEQTLAAVAEALAFAINNTDDDYVATTAIDVLVIINKAGVLDATFGITPPVLDDVEPEPDSVQVDSTTSTAAAKLKLVGDIVVNDVWTLSLAGISYYRTILPGDTLTSLAEYFAVEINADGAASDYTATNEENTLVVVNRTGTDFSMSLEVMVQPIVILGGVPVVDDTWTITLGGTAFPHTVTHTTDTLSTIATALATAIDTSGGTVDYVSAAVGETITITRADGAAFSISVNRPDDMEISESIALVHSPAFVRQIDLTTYCDEVEGDTWYLLLVVDDVVSKHSFTVGATSDWSDIATGLAEDINTNADQQFTAMTEGGVLIIVHRADAEFTMANAYSINTVTETTKVQLSGILVTGEVWSVILDDSETRTTISHVVVEGQTVGELAAALAVAIKERAPNDFIATTDNGLLVIVNRAGNDFTTTMNVTTVGNITVLESVKTKQPENSDRYFYGPVNPNIRVNEADQVDVMNVFHGNSPANDIGELTENSLTGLGMGGDTIIAGRELPGGITYYDLETLNIELGTGNDDFTIESTHKGATNLNSGAGDDTINVETISGHTSISTEDGADTINVQNADHLVDPVNGLLTVNGGGDQTDSLAHIAEAIAYLINTTNRAAVDAGYVATANGAVLTIVNENNTSFTPTFSITAAGAAGTEGSYSIDPVSSALSVDITLEGAPVSGEEWAVTLNGTTFTHIVRPGDVLNVDDKGEEDPNTGTLTERTLTGLDMPTVSEIQTVYVQAASGTYQLLISDDHIDLDTATSTLVTLSDTPLDGDIWTLTLTIGDLSTEFSLTIGNDYLVGETVITVNTLDDIAAFFVDAINASDFGAEGDNAGFTVTVDGTTLVIVNLDGADFSTSVAVISEPTSLGGSYTIETRSVENFTLWTVSLIGEPAVGDTWTVTVDGTPYEIIIGDSYDTGSSSVIVDTLEEIAAALAVIINGDLTGSDWLVSANGQVISIANLEGVDFTVALEVVPEPTEPAGDSVLEDISADDVTWRVVTLAGNASENEAWQLLLTIGGQTTSYAYVIPDSGATLEAISAAIAADLDEYLGQNWFVVAEGSAINIIKASVGTFSVDFAILPYNIETDVTTTSVLLSGTPMIGDTWTVTVNGIGYNVIVGNTYNTVVVDTLEEIAAEFAAQINADDINLADFTASTDGSALVIVNRAGDAFVTIFDITLAASGSVGSMVVAYHDATTVAQLSGVVEADDEWNIYFSIDPAVFSYSYVAAEGDTLTDISAGLAAAINLAGSGYLAIAEGSVLAVTNLAGNAFVTEFSITPSGGAEAPIPMALIASNSTAIAQLGGTEVPGELWKIDLTVDLAVTTFCYEVGATDTLSDVAAGLALAINDADTDYLAASDGATLIITNKAGETFTASFTLLLEAMTFGTFVVVEGVDPVTSIATLSGDPVTGETWTLALWTDTDVETVYEVIVGNTYGEVTAETLADIALVLADLINADETNASEFTAVADGTTIIIVNRTGINFMPDVTIPTAKVELSGTPVADEIWTLAINDVPATTYAVSVDGVVDTLDKIAQTLADAINADTPSFDLVAAANGSTLLVVDLTEGAETLTLTLEITAAAVSVTDDSVPATTVTLGGVPILGDTWTIELDDGASYVYSYQVGKTGTLITLLGETTIGEIWTFTVNGVDHALTIDATLEELPDLAAALAAEINTTALAGALTATISVAVDPSDESVDGSMSYSGSPVYEVTLSGTPATGEVWRIIVDGEVFEYTAEDIDELEDIAAALAALIDADPIYWATADGSTVSIVHPPYSAVADGATVLIVDKADPVEIVTVTADITTIEGAVAIGTIATLADIADFLVDGINSGGTNFRATVVDNTLVIVNHVKTTFDTTASISGSGSIVDTPTPEISVTGTHARTLTGIPVAGEIWAVTIDTLDPISYTVLSGDTLADVAAGLAAAINGDAAASAYTALTINEILLISNRSDAALTTSLEVTPVNRFVKLPITAVVTVGGTPANDEVWTVGFDTFSFDYTVHPSVILRLAGTPVAGEQWSVVLDITPLDELPGTLPVVHTVLADQTLADVVSSLAGQINTITDFTAIVNGSAIVVVNTDNVEFSVSTGVLWVPAASATINLSGTPAADEIWTVYIDGTGYSVTLDAATIIEIDTDTSGSVSPDEIAEKLEALINLAGITDLTAEAIGTTLNIAYAVDSSAISQFAVSLTPADPEEGSDGEIVLNSPSTNGSINVIADASLSAITNWLAYEINAAGKDYTATAVGEQLIISNSAAEIFTTTFTISAGTGNYGIRQAAYATTTETTLTGTPVVGETWTVVLTSDYTTTLTLAGVPETAEEWTVTLDSTDYTVIVGDSYDVNGQSTVVDSLVEVAGALAGLINDANGLVAFKAIAIGSTLEIRNLAAESFAVTAVITNLSGNGSIAVEAGVTSTYSHIVSDSDGSTDTLDDIAAALALAINTDGPVGFSAVARGTTLIIANQTGRAFTSEFQILPSGGFVVIGARTVTFERTPAVDETWVVRLAGINYSIDVTVPMTQAEIADALAVLINADTDEGADWQATTYADTLIIVSRSGESFGVAVVITSDTIDQSPADFSIDSPNAVTATSATPVGTPFADEEWTLTIGVVVPTAGDGGSSTVFTNYTASGTTSGAILTDLQTQIEAADITGDFVIEIVDNVLIIISKAVALVELTGEPALGETWTISINETQFDVIVGNTYNSVEVDTLPEIVSTFAGMIVGLTGFTVVVDGTTLEIRHDSGDGFTVAAEVTPPIPAGEEITRTIEVLRAGGADLSVAYEVVSTTFSPDIQTSTGMVDSNAVQLAGTPVAGETWTIDVGTGGTLDYTVVVSALASLSGTPTDGEIWTIFLDGTRYDVIVGHIYNMVEVHTLAEIATALAEQITVADNNFTATSLGDGLQISNTAGTRFTITLAIDTVAGSLAVAMDSVWTDTLSYIAGDLATQVNADTTALAAGFTAIVRGDQLLIINDAVTFTLNSSITPADDWTTDPPTNPSTVIQTLSGTPGEGQRWTLKVDGHNFTHLVLQGQTLAEVSQALADLVNDSVLVESDYAIVADGDLLVIVKLSGIIEESETGLTILPASTADVDESTAHAEEVTPSGSVNSGETWTVTVDGHSYSVEGGTVLEVNEFGEESETVDTIVEVVAILSGLINADIYSAIVVGDTLIVINKDGTLSTPTFTVIPSGAGLVDTITPVVETLTPTAIPEVDQTWYLLLSVDGAIHAFSHPVIDTDGNAGEPYTAETLDVVLQELVDALNAENVPGIVATLVDGNQIVAFSQDGEPFSLALEIARADGSLTGSVQIAGSNVMTVLADLDGTLAVGEEWTVLLLLGEESDLDRESVLVGHTVTLVDDDGDPETDDLRIETLAEVAAALAAEINLTALGDFIAMVEGNTLVIVNLSGEEFSVVTTILPVRLPAGSGAVTVLDPDSDSTMVVNLGGTIRVDQIWTLQLTVDDETTEYTYVVMPGDNIFKVAGALSALIAMDEISGIAVAVEGEALVITDRFARTLEVFVAMTPPRFFTIDETTATTTTVQFSGTPVDGEEWSLLIDDLFWTLTISGAPAADSVEFDTWFADQVAWFAAEINADPEAESFTAWTEGTLLVITNRAGNAFETSLLAQDVTRLAGEAFTTLEYGLSADEVEKRLRILYGLEDIEVTARIGVGNITYSIKFVRDQAGIDFEQIIWNETQNTTGLLPSAGSSADVLINTVQDGSFDAGLNNIQTIEVDATGGEFTLSFLLENEDGEFVIVTTAPIPYNATALDLYKILSMVLNPNGSTIDIDPVFDRDTRNPSRPYTDNVAVSKFGNVFQITFQGAYADLSIYDIDTLNLDGAARTVTVAVSGVTDGAAAIDTTTATTSTVILSGEAGTDDLYTLTLLTGGNRVEFVYEAQGGETADVVAAQLAAIVNQRAGAGFVATADDNVLAIINTVGTLFVTKFSLTNKSGSVAGTGGYTIDDVTASTTIVDLSGTPLTGEVWTTVVLSDDSTVLVNVEYTVLAVDADNDPLTPETRPESLAEIAAALASLINGAGLGDIVATADDDALLITSLSGASFETTLAVTPYGLPVDGDAWTIILTNTETEVTGLAVDYTYIVEMGDTPSDVAAALADKINTLGAPEYFAWTESNLLIIESLGGNKFTVTVTLVKVAESNASFVIEPATAVVETRVDGINYYGIKILNIDLGKGDDVFNVQGTSAIANLNLGKGDERVYVSSSANFDLETDTDFLRGHLNDVDGMLNINAGTGRHKLMISDESATIGDSDVLITDTFGSFDTPDTAAARSELQHGVTGEALLDTEIYIVGLAEGAITYQADTDAQPNTAANFAEGITIWSGFGADHISIDGTHYREGLRTITTLNTGLGDDTVTVDLDYNIGTEADPVIDDGFFVLNTQGPYNDFLAISDNDQVYAADSTLPLVIFGGQGRDIIVGGQANDIIFGDRGRVLYFAEETTWDYTMSLDELTNDAGTVLGHGGPGDKTDGVKRDDFFIVTVDETIAAANANDRVDGSSVANETLADEDIILGGGNDGLLGEAGPEDLRGGEDDDILIGDYGQIVVDDYLPRRVETDPDDSEKGGGDIIEGGSGQDVVIGGAFGDVLDGNAGEDLIIGDNALLDRTTRTGDYTNLRFQTLQGTLLYDAQDNALIDGTPRDNPDQWPSWSDFALTLRDHSLVVETEGDTNFGDDYIAGGANDDMIFGQLGDDVIQGDGSIDSWREGTPVNAYRDADGLLQVDASVEDEGGNGTDGDDYIEGNGGNDIIFGNLGQDDILGGSSDFYGLSDSLLRPDGADLIFGGAGTDISRNNLGQAVLEGGVITTGEDGHSRDSDMILGDNGRIVRLVDASGQYLEFNYDQNPGETAGYSEDQLDYESRGDLRIRVRAAELLDYTLGGHDYDADSAENDIGSPDEIHGESGDDFIYGMVGNDVLFGEGQDDDLIGGYGHDWISGGTGVDGVLGDDGRIYTSRNVELKNDNDPELYSEPLYDILRVDEVDKRINTPGNIQVAYINPAYALKKTVNLTPFNLDPTSGSQDPLYDANFADDVIYGGLGNDFLHGGAGDDAISGAEALPEYYADPDNPGNLLSYGDPHAGEFAAYYEYDPLRKILVDETGAWTDDPTAREFILNFLANDSNAPNDPYATGIEFALYPTDGDDRIFGDLGNDWLVGGTGRDHLFGGRGDDLLNADDDHDSTTGTGDDRANNIPDTHPSYEDIAYGGAGRDVLIANTGGDRLIDWVGEFNSYLVPFAPFGAFTISRSLQPQLMEYLYELSASDGADPTRSDDTGADPLRNGEPDGEIGLVMQKDFDWQDQTGAPDDIQAGNIPGGSRDVMRSADFNSGTAEGFAADSGLWSVENGRFVVAPEVLGGDAVSVFYVDSYLPSYFEMRATINAGKPIAGLKSNAYLIFDYQSQFDFKFAGVNISTDKMVMGHRTAEGWIVDEQTPAQLKPNQDYNLLLALNGTVATLVVNNDDVFSHVYAPRVDIYGVSHGLNAGMVGIGAENSMGRIDNVAVQILPPVLTLNETETFDDGVADRFDSGDVGDWQIVDGHYEGLPVDSDRASSMMNLRVGATYLLRFEATLSTRDMAGLVFDQYGPDDFKFVALSATTNEVVIGHHTARHGWKVDAVVERTIESGYDYDLKITLKGTTISVALDGQAVLGYVFNALLVDGSFGLFTNHAASSFDVVTVQTDDPAYIDAEGNTVPVAGDDNYSTSPEQPLVISAASLLDNDSDADGDPLMVANFTQPANGQLVDNGDGTYTYTPNAEFAGTDSFTYQAGDGLAFSDLATVAITVTASVAGTYTYTMTPAELIPDNGFDTWTITVPDSYTILDLNVVLDIDHTRDSDLEVFLVNPDGLRIELFAGVGGPGQGFVGTILVDDATTSIVDGTAPFTDVFRPTGNLSLLEGLNVNGSWTLEIYDVKKRETGTLNSWSIVVERGNSLLAGSAPMPSTTEPQSLTQTELDQTVDEAISRWIDSGLLDESQLAQLETLNFDITDLTGLTLGLATADTIYIDINAAGFGWFIDPTPDDDSEFNGENRDGLLRPFADNAADGRMDLLTVVTHEIGHLLGLDHSASDDVRPMSETLDAGVRLVFTPESTAVTTAEGDGAVFAMSSHNDTSGGSPDTLAAAVIAEAVLTQASGAAASGSQAIFARKNSLTHVLAGLARCHPHA